MARGLVAPKDWKTSLLDSVTDRGSGHTPDKEVPEYWNGGVKWVSLADSSKLDLGYIAETDKEISLLGIAKSSAVLHPANTVIMSRDAGVGKSAVLKTDMAVSQHFIAWRCERKQTVNPWFLYNWLQFHKAEFERQAVGSTIKTIGLPYFRRLAICYPPLAEQRRIAEILATWDRAIETVEAMIANARAKKKALMQSLLTGKHRLPGFSGDWRWVKFSEVFERVRHKNDVGNTNVLTISAQHGLISQVEYFNKSVASEDVRGYTLLQQGDFAYNKSYSDGYPMGAFKPLERYDSGIVSSLYICFRLVGEEHDHGFFRHYFEAGLFNREISAIAQEGARNHGLLNVSVVDFFDTSLHAPSHDEQVAIATVIKGAEQAEQALRNQLAALRQEKSALMQQLLTGKRRVKLTAREAA